MRRGGLGAAEVEDLEARREVERANDAVDDVVDVGVVAPGRAGAVERHRLAARQQVGELGDRHLGPLRRAVDGEEAQAGRAQAVEVVVVEAEQLAGPLGRGVGLIGWSTGSSSANGTFSLIP